jgi:hypothetical protein
MTEVCTCRSHEVFNRLVLRKVDPVLDGKAQERKEKNNGYENYQDPQDFIVSFILKQTVPSKMIFDLLDNTTSLKLLNKGNSGSVVYISEEKDKSFSNYLVMLKNNQINIKITDIDSMNS